MASLSKSSSNIENVIEAWRPYASSVTDWRALTLTVEPKATGCGPVYELSSPLQRSGVSLAIADMRGIAFAQPHYHANGEVEIYFVLEGIGQVVVGGEVMEVGEGSIVAIPSGTAHYALPGKDQGLVFLVINTPPFDSANNIEVRISNPEVGYDHQQFLDLTK